MPPADKRAELVNLRMGPRFGSLEN
jgi:hypothetical protein